MTKEEYQQKVWDEALQQRGCFWPMFRLAVIIVLVAFAFVSCATKTKIEYRDRDVNHYITNVVHDTLRVETKDSTYHSVKVVNDTVYDTKYVERTRWRDRVVERKDTCWRDSIVTEYKETTKEVVKYPKTYWYAVGISILFLILSILKLAKWLKTII